MRITLLALALGVAVRIPLQAQGTACQVEPPDALPPVQEQAGWPEERGYLIADTIEPANLMYRRVIAVVFEANATGRMLNDILCKYHGVIIGGRDTGNGFYAIRFPDPGPSWSTVNALLDSLGTEPGVEFAGPFFAKGPRTRLN